MTYLTINFMLWNTKKNVYFSKHNSVKQKFNVWLLLWGTVWLYWWKNILFSKVKPWADQWRGARERERGGDLNALDISNSCPCTVQTSLQYWASSQPGQLSKTGKGCNCGIGDEGQGDRKRKKRKKEKQHNEYATLLRGKKGTTWERNKKKEMKIKENKRK